jgi:hypothetical protein
MMRSFSYQRGRQSSKACHLEPVYTTGLGFLRTSKPTLPELTPETKGIAEVTVIQLRESTGMGVVARGWGDEKGVQRFVHCRGLPPVSKTNSRAQGMTLEHGFVSHSKHISKVPNNTTISL